MCQKQQPVKAHKRRPRTPRNRPAVQAPPSPTSGEGPGERVSGLAPTSSHWRMDPGVIIGQRVVAVRCQQQPVEAHKRRPRTSRKRPSVQAPPLSHFGRGPGGEGVRPGANAQPLADGPRRHHGPAGGRGPLPATARRSPHARPLHPTQTPRRSSAPPLPLRERGRGRGYPAWPQRVAFVGWTPASPWASGWSWSSATRSAVRAHQRRPCTPRKRPPAFKRPPSPTSGEGPGERASALAPQRGFRRMDPRRVIGQRVVAVLCQQQRPVKIHDPCPLRQQNRRGHRQ